MLRSLLVSSLSAGIRDVGREGWERRLEVRDRKASPGREGERERAASEVTFLGPCPFRLTFLPFHGSLLPQAVLGSCKEWRSWGGDQRIVR